MSEPGTMTASRAFSLYVHAEINDRWARSIRRHQTRLAWELAHPRASPLEQEEPIPWALADICWPDHRYGRTSVYRGVSRSPHKWQGQPTTWEAYRPGTRIRARKYLGRFATELEAAWAVLKAMNPDVKGPDAPSGD